MAFFPFSFKWKFKVFKTLPFLRTFISYEPKKPEFYLSILVGFLIQVFGHTILFYFYTHQF